MSKINSKTVTNFQQETSCEEIALLFHQQDLYTANNKHVSDEYCISEKVSDSI